MGKKEEKKSTSERVQTDSRSQERSIDEGKAIGGEDEVKDERNERECAGE